jgi:hypothetical protein
MLNEKNKLNQMKKILLLIFTILLSLNISAQKKDKIKIPDSIRKPYTYTYKEHLQILGKECVKSCDSIVAVIVWKNGKWIHDEKLLKKIKNK